MRRISARYLLGMSTERLWELLAGPFTLVFDDGTDFNTNARETLFSSYAWNFHRTYPKTPLLPKHHVAYVLRGGRLRTSSHLKLLGNCLWSVRDTYIDDPAVKLEQLAEMTYRLVNLMYNDLTYRLEEYVTGLCITDYVQILDHPDILAAKEGAPETNEAIKHIQSVIKKTLKEDPVLRLNPIAKATESGVANMSQVLQCVGPRGFVSDIDSFEFPRPIMRGFAEGIHRDFYWSLIESRHSAMSLAQSKDPLEQTEYFNRRLQLIAQTLRNLHPGDCGSTEYLYWTFAGEEFDEAGDLVKKSDVDFFAGKYFVNASGGLTCIKKGDDHLIGHTVKLRSPLMCGHPDPHGICSTCLGQMSESILDPLTGNIGQTMATYLTELISQLVLSTKHDAGSGGADAIVLDEVGKHYFQLTGDRNSYLLHQRLKDSQVRIVIPHKFAANLTELLDVQDVNQLPSITRISELPAIKLVVGAGESVFSSEFKVSQDRRMASMTYQLLSHIKKHNFTLSERGDYVINMAGWDFSQPILVLPKKRYNMSDHAAEIANLLESSVKEITKRDKPEEVNHAMSDLFELVNARLNINFAVLEMVLYVNTIVDSANGNFTLPKAATVSRPNYGTRRGMGSYELTIENRSASAKMAYEHQLATIMSPRNYITPNRMDHPMDAIFLPNEILQPLEE